jgi:hypothetical protein
LLVRFHILLIASGILFCAGFALLQVYRDGDLWIAGAAILGALILGIYLYRVRRYGIRG